MIIGLSRVFKLESVITEETLEGNFQIPWFEQSDEVRVHAGIACGWQELKSLSAYF